MRHCICGANADESHIGDCDGYAVLWKAHEMKGSTTLPTSVGYWYLVDADGTANNKVNAARSNVTNKNGIYVDFHGVEVTMNTDVRFGNLWCSSTTTPTVIVYTDSSQDHTGKLITACPTATDQ